MNKIVFVLASIIALSATTVAHAQRATATVPANILNRTVYYDVEGGLYEAPLSTQELILTCEKVHKGTPSIRPLGNGGDFHITCEYTDNGATFREAFVFQARRWPEFNRNRQFNMLYEIRLLNLSTGLQTTLAAQDLYRRYEELAGYWDRQAARLGIDRTKLRKRRPNID